MIAASAPHPFRTTTSAPIYNSQIRQHSSSSNQQFPPSPSRTGIIPPCAAFAASSSSSHTPNSVAHTSVSALSKEAEVERNRGRVFKSTPCSWVFKHGAKKGQMCDAVLASHAMLVKHTKVVHVERQKKSISPRDSPALPDPIEQPRTRLSCCLGRCAVKAGAHKTIDGLMEHVLEEHLWAKRGDCPIKGCPNPPSINNNTADHLAKYHPGPLISSSYLPLASRNTFLALPPVAGPPLDFPDFSAVAACNISTPPVKRRERAGNGKVLELFAKAVSGRDRGLILREAVGFAPKEDAQMIDDFRVSSSWVVDERPVLANYYYPLVEMDLGRTVRTEMSVGRKKNHPKPYAWEALAAARSRQAMGRQELARMKDVDIWRRQVAEGSSLEGLGRRPAPKSIGIDRFQKSKGKQVDRRNDGSDSGSDTSSSSGPSAN